MEQLPNTPLLQIRLSPGLPEQECCQQVKSSDPSPLFSTGEAMPGLLCPVLASPEKERDGHSRESSKRPQRWLRDWSISHMSKTREPGEGSWGSYQSMQKNRRESAKEIDWVSFQVWPVTMTMGTNFFTLRVTEYWHRVPKARWLNQIPVILWHTTMKEQHLSLQPYILPSLCCYS